ncbi:deazaflavin-dependent oxidoreductase, nitroreductase family [Microbacterium sp. cf046]|uniref:nitroreductase family deazaflavin-dependent oxidoreductase n=1 Tax=Microbacterium sp. cf046 TaxID=1761803 RepID=UPI0008EB76B5|nr:nitroreductase family deazaflavin-dependent oxidoreductase [Microbacterium sp. cf046]SFS06946.1 deazaflavin-dependent oxidoreductase, nitroreductase family [Microbacterium sp. cf046]
MTEPKRTSGVAKTLQRVSQPVALAMAGHRWLPIWAVIHHRGRSSGTQYRTPIAIIPTNDRNIVLIGLPWGVKTNWALNVVAAGGASLTWKGGEHQAVDPRIIEPIEASVLARPFFRFVVRRMPGAIALTRAS